jgi:ABC-2 type transport system ATP-binding protein
VKGIAICTENLTCDFGTLRAVDSLSLQVPTGTVFGFLGPNGAGKTTTIRLLLGLLEPTSGKAEVLGFDTHKQADKIRLQVGVLLQYDGLYERLSAEENLEFYARIWHLPNIERQTRIRELLTHLGLWDRRKEIVKTWSSGMRRKLALARSLLHRPAILFLDEPTASLDPIAATTLHQDLYNIVAREGTTIFLTTHNLSEAEKLCREIGVIVKGKLVAVGTPDELRMETSGARIEVRGYGFKEKTIALIKARKGVEAVDLQNGRLVVKLRDEKDITSLISFMIKAGVEVEEIHKASLEETFLKLVEEEK